MDTVRPRSLLIALVLGLAVAWSATPAVAQEEVRIGAFAPISGISADVGAQIRAGTEVAVERVQQRGLGVGGRPHRVRVIWYDTEGKGDVGLNVVTRALTVDKTHAGVGFLSSDVFIRVMDEFQKAPTPVVACCAASLKIGDKIGQNRMGFVFQLSPTANDIARSLASAVAATVKPQKIGLPNENTDAGRDFSRLTREWFAASAKGVEVVADEFVERGVTDLTAQLSKMKRAGAPAIIERDPARVLRDVLEEKISADYARREYGVAVDEAPGRAEETASLRAALRATAAARTG